jgi:hypothetical protein
MSTETISQTSNQEFRPAAPIKLAHGEQRVIDRDAYLETYDENGIQGNVVARVRAATTLLKLIDVRWDSERYDGASYLITGKSGRNLGKIGYLGISYGQTVTVGRQDRSGALAYDNTVSLRHFEGSYGRHGLAVTNLYPTNSTWLTLPDPNPRNEKYEVAHPRQADRLRDAPGRSPENVKGEIRTHYAVARAESSNFYGYPDQESPYGYYYNRPIIGRYSKGVDGGVYMGGSSREAIVVDGDSPLMTETYDAIKYNLTSQLKSLGTMSELDMLQVVVNHVKDVMPYNGNKTSAISRQFHGDQLVNLSQFLENRAGVCRHQGLLTSYLTERLIRDGFLEGTVAMERNESPDNGGVHAWGIFHGKETYVMDPAQKGFVGTKEEARRRHLWKYDLSTDGLQYGPFSYNQGRP